MFGSLVSETVDFFEDITSHRSIYVSPVSSPAFSPTPPFRTNSANRKPNLNVPGSFTCAELRQMESFATDSTASTSQGSKMRYDEENVK